MVIRGMEGTGNNMEEQIMVTISCITYNHEKYIEQALDGFVMQKTNFKYEVIVHDDASTDGTADIIRRYAENYPDIIRPILQTENQYSKGLSIGRTFVYPNARGKYLALCEGDDYWTDENKLQMQVDFLEEHPEYSMCCHNSYRYSVDTGKFKLESPIKKQGDVSARDIILEPSKTWIATSSIMYRTELAFNRPELFSLAPVGDFPMKLYCFSKGKVYYFDKAMSVYRRGDANAWTMKIKKSLDMKIEFHYRLVLFLEAYDEYTNRAYHKYIKQRLKHHRHWRNEFMSDYPKVKNNKYFKQMPLKFRLAKRVKYYHPEMYENLRRVKKAVKGKK